MSPITHFMAGWVLANTVRLNQRERLCVTLAGVLPDLDGLGIIAETISRDSPKALTWYSEYHHVLGHNLGLGLALAGLTFALNRRRWPAAWLALVSFHLHLLGDLIGARGPDGEQWPIPYLWPFLQTWKLTWAGQWALNAWPNFLVTGLLMAATIWQAWKLGYSPLEMISGRANLVFVQALRRRLGAPSHLSEGTEHGGTPPSKAHP
jgi:hypothetical protein